MNRFFSRDSKIKEDTPFVDLLVYRSLIPFVSTDTPEARLFEKIPQMDKNQLQKLKSDSSIFSKINIKYMRSDLEAIHAYASQMQPTEVSCYIILYHCLSWYYSIDRQIDDFILAIKALNLIFKCSPTLENIRNFVYINFVKLTTSPPPRFKLTEEVYHFLILHLSKNTSLEKSSFNLISQLFRLVINKSSEKYIDEMYDVIIHMFNVNSPFFDYDMISSFMPILNIAALNPKALMILAKLTLKSSANSIMDAYVMIPSSIVEHLLKLKPVFEFESRQIDFGPNIDTIQVKERRFVDHSFTSDFQPLPYNVFANLYDITELMSYEAQTKIYELTPSINICSKEAQKSFISTSLRILIAMPTEKNFYLLSASFFFIFQKIIDRDFLKLMLPLISQSVVFSQNFSVFDDLSKTMNTLRNYIFVLIENIHPPHVVLFLTALKDSPVILVECLIRILYNIQKYPLGLFTSKEMIEIITEAGLKLQAMPPSPITFKARNAYFSFVNELLTSPQSAYECLKTQFFCDHFLWYLYEPCLTDHILVTLRNAISSVAHHSDLKHCAEFLRDVIFHCDDQISLKISSNLVEGLRNNASVAFNFVVLFDPLLESAEKHRSAAILDKSLELLVLSSMSLTYEMPIRNYRQFARCIKAVYGNEPPKRVEWLLFGTMARTFSDPPTFIIRVPSVIPLVLTAFASSQRIMGIMKMFVKLCYYSEHNRKACHDGGVVFILSQLIIGNNVHYSDYEFEFNVTEIDKEKVIFPLIRYISIAHSDNSIAQFFVNNLEKPKVAPFLLSLLEQCEYSTKPHFPVGKMPKQFTVKGIYPDDLKNGFTIHISINLDLFSITDPSKPIDILRLSDANESFLSIFIVNSGISAKFEGNGIRTTVPLVKAPDPCVFTDFTFVFSVLEDRIRISSFKNLDPLNDSDFCLFEFTSSDLVLSFGGYDGSYSALHQYATVTNFQIFPTTEISHKDIVKSLFTVEPQCLFSSNYINEPSVANEFQIKRSINKSVKNCSGNIFVTVFDTLPNAKNLLGIVLSSNYSNQIASKFFVEGVLGVVQLLFQKSEWVQMEFLSVKTIHSHLMKNTKLLTARLYFELFEIFRDISFQKLQNEWFKTLLINVWLWSQTSYGDLVRILDHWGKELVYSYSSLFSEDDNYFSSLLAQFRLFFCGDDECVKTFAVQHFDETYVDDQCFNTCRDLFLSFVGKVAGLCMSKSDIDEFFNHIMSGPTKTTLLNLLSLFFSFGRNVDTSEHFLKLISLLCDDNDINEAVILAVHYMFKDGSFQPLITTFENIKNKDIELFNRLRERIKDFPNLMPVLCIFALELNKEDELADQLSTQKQYIAQTVVTNEFWYVWPVMLGFNTSSQESSMKVCDFISFTLSVSDNFKQDLPYTAVSISLAMFTTNETDFLRTFISSLDVIDKANQMKVKSIVELCFHICFFHFYGQKYHGFVLEALNEAMVSLYMDEKFVFTEKEQPSIMEKMNNLNSLRKLSKMSYTSIHLQFDLRIDLEKKWKDAHFAASAMNLLSNSAYQNEIFALVFQYFTDPRLLGQEKEVHKLQIELDSIIQDQFNAYSSTVKLCFSSFTNYLQKMFAFIAKNSVSLEKDAGPITEKMRDEIERSSNLNITVINHNNLKPDMTFCEFFAPMKKKRSYLAPKFFRTIQSIGENIFDFPCKIIKHSAEEKAPFRGYTKFIQIGDKYIDGASLNMVLTRRKNGKETLIELFMNTGSSYLLDISPNDSANVIKTIAKANYPNINIIQKTNAMTLFSQIPTKNLWESGQISNFEYLLIINLFSGRSFNDNSIAPVMPSLVCNNDVTRVNNIEASTASVHPDYYISASEDRDFEFLYNLRKLLESPSISQKLSGYIDNVFGFKSPANSPSSPLFKKKHASKQKYKKRPHPKNLENRMKLKIAFANLIKNEGSTYILNVITTNREHRLLKIETLNFKIEISEASEIDINEHSVFTGFMKRTLVFNRKRCQLNTFNEKAKEDTSFFFSETDFIICGDNIFVFCPNFCSVAVKSLITNRIRIIWNSDSKITQLTANAIFRVFAFSTLQNDVSVHSINTGCEVNRIKVEHEVNRLLITRRWGFVIAFAHPEVYLLSVNGEFIKKCEFDERVTIAFSFVSMSGFDYVVYQNDVKQICIFEAFYPDKREIIFEATSEMKIMFYDTLSSSIIIIFANGLIQLIPYSSIE